MKRNLINEIIDIKSRLDYNSRHDYSSRLIDIENAFKNGINSNLEFNTELIKYIPIATVACFEAFFRSVYKELIDFGQPFNNNAIKFNQSKNVKFDFDIINAIQSKTVTVGEFISHILPCNNYDDINTNLSTITDKDFTDSIKSFKKDSSESFENHDQIISDIKRIFELRHIFCHEFATNFKVDNDEIIRCFMNAKKFLHHTNNFIWDLLYPNAPITQTDMNIQAKEQFDFIEKELNELILTIKESLNEFSAVVLDLNILDESIEEWKKYRTKKAEFDSSCVNGGTMYPLLFGSSMTKTTKEKIESLKLEYEYELRKNASR